MDTARIPFRKLFPLACAAALLAACNSAPVATSPSTAGASTVKPAGQCNADAVQWAVGQEASESTMGRVWRESGAGLIRPIGPNQAVTMDFRADRVNVTLDKDNRITRVSCG